MQINKVLGKKGRITIPFEIRKRMGFAYNDILSFEEQNDNTIVIRRVKICDGCRNMDASLVDKPTDETTLLEFIDGLSTEEQRAAFVHLMMKWTDLKGGDQ
jgi:AbrB family looped-hinge helix DNA binding protein